MHFRPPDRRNENSERPWGVRRQDARARGANYCMNRALLLFPEGTYYVVQRVARLFGSGIMLQMGTEGCRIYESWRKLGEGNLEMSALP